MKPATFLVLALLSASGSAWSADAEPAGPDNNAPVPADTFTPMDRGAFFIGNMIANLRGLDPSFGVRTLSGARTTGLPASGVSIIAVGLPATWTDGQLSERRACATPGRTCGTADLLLDLANGSTQLLARSVNGQLIPLARSHVVFDCAVDAGSGGRNEPAVIDLQGTMTALPSHPAPVRSCARTGTGDEVLLVYSIVQNGRPQSLARVFDGNGSLLAEGAYEQEGAVNFSVSGRQYSAKVPAP